MHLNLFRRLNRFGRFMNALLEFYRCKIKNTLPIA